MKSEAIKTPAEYVAALKEIDGLMSAERGTSEGRRLQILANLVQEYEALHFPIKLPKPVGNK